MTGADDDFRLALYRGASGEWLPLDQVLDALTADTPLDVSAEHTTISVVAGGQEHLAGLVSFGSLPRLVNQLEPAADRLEQDAWALVRSAVLDVPHGIYLLLEPHSPTQDVAFSLAVTEELPWSGWFPDDDARGRELHGYVASHRDQMVADAEMYGIKPACLDRTSLTAALRREAHLGRQLIEELGW